MKQVRKKGLGSAHGKIILIGEHSVVHQQPAIALPFTSAKVEVEIKEITGPVILDSLYYHGKLNHAPNHLRNLRKTLDAVSLYLGEAAREMKITIHSQIPAERGMGSSAAVATALVRALFHYFNRKLTSDLLDKFVSISEEIAHGNPSGIDAKVVQSDHAIYFLKGRKAEPFDIHLPAYIVVADTGEKGDTLSAVTDVGKLLADERTKGQQWIEELGQLTVQAREKIERKDIEGLGKILTQAQALLKSLKVSNAALDHLVDTAMDNGALGAKLTGGGRGGCMIALVRKEAAAKDLAKKLLAENAVETWVHPLGVNKYGK